MLDTARVVVVLVHQCKSSVVSVVERCQMLNEADNVAMFFITALYLLKVCHFQFTYSSLHVDVFAGFWNMRRDTLTHRIQSEHRLLRARVLFQVVARSEFQRGL